MSCAVGGRAAGGQSAAAFHHAPLGMASPFAPWRQADSICYVTSGDRPGGDDPVASAARSLLTLSDPTTLGGIGNALTHFARDQPDARRHLVALRLRAGRAYPELLATLHTAALKTVRGDGETRLPWAATITIGDHAGNELLRYEPGNGVWPHHFVFTVAGPKQAATNLKQRITEVRAQWTEAVADELVELRLGCAPAELNAHMRGKLVSECAAGLEVLRARGFRNVLVRAGIETLGAVRDGEVVGAERAIIDAFSPSPRPSPQRERGALGPDRVTAADFVTPLPIDGLGGPHLIPTMPQMARDRATALAEVPYRTTDILALPSWGEFSAATPFAIRTLQGHDGIPDLTAICADATCPLSIRAIGLPVPRAFAALCDAALPVSCALHTNTNGSYIRYLRPDVGVFGHEFTLPTVLVGPIVAALCRLAMLDPARARVLQQSPLAITLMQFASVPTSRFIDWLDDVLRLLRERGFAQVVVRDRSGHVLAASDRVTAVPPQWAGMELPAVAALPDPVPGQGGQPLRMRGDGVPVDTLIAQLHAWLRMTERSFPVEVCFATPTLSESLIAAVRAMQREYGAARLPRVAVVTPLEQWEIGEWGTLSQWSVALRTVAAARGLALSRTDLEEMISMLRLFGAEALWSEDHARSRVGPTAVPVAIDPAVSHALALNRAARVFAVRIGGGESGVSAGQYLPYADLFAGLAEQGWAPYLLGPPDAAAQSAAHEGHMFAGVRGSARPPLHCLVRLGAGADLVVRHLPLFERVWRMARAAARDAARFDRSFASPGRPDWTLPREAELTLLRCFCVTMALAELRRPSDALLEEAWNAVGRIADLGLDASENDPAAPCCSLQHPWGGAIQTIRTALRAARGVNFPIARPEDLAPTEFVEAGRVPTTIPVGATPFLRASEQGRGTESTLAGSAAEQCAALRTQLAALTTGSVPQVTFFARAVAAVEIFPLLSDPALSGSIEIVGQHVGVSRAPLAAGGYGLDISSGLDMLGRNIEELLSAAERGPARTLRELPISITLLRSAPLITRGIQHYLEDALWRLQRAGYRAVVVRDNLGDVIAATDALPDDVRARLEAPLFTCPADADAMAAADEAAWQDFLTACDPDRVPRTRMTRDRYLRVNDRVAVQVLVDPELGVPRGVVIDGAAVPDDWLVAWLLALTDGGNREAAWLRSCPIELHWRDQEVPAALLPLLPSLDAMGVAGSLYGLRIVTSCAEYFFATTEVLERYLEAYLAVVRRQLQCVSSDEELWMGKTILLQLIMGRTGDIPLSPKHNIESGLRALSMQRQQEERMRRGYVERGYALLPLPLLFEMVMRQIVSSRVNFKLIASRGAIAQLDAARWMAEIPDLERLLLPGPTLHPLWREPIDRQWAQQFGVALTTPTVADTLPPLNLLIQLAHYGSYRFRSALLPRVWPVMLAQQRDRARYVAQFALPVADFAEWPPFEGAVQREAIKLCVTCQALEVERTLEPTPELIARGFAAVAAEIEATTDAEWAQWNTDDAAKPPNWSLQRPEGRALAAARAVVRGEDPPRFERASESALAALPLPPGFELADVAVRDVPLQSVTTRIPRLPPLSLFSPGVGARIWTIESRSGAALTVAGVLRKILELQVEGNAVLIGGIELSRSDILRVLAMIDGPAAVTLTYGSALFGRIPDATGRCWGFRVHAPPRAMAAIIKDLLLIAAEPEGAALHAAPIEFLVAELGGPTDGAFQQWATTAVHFLHAAGYTQASVVINGGPVVAAADALDPLPWPLLPRRQLAQPPVGTRTMAVAPGPIVIKREMFDWSRELVNAWQRCGDVIFVADDSVDELVNAVSMVLSLARSERSGGTRRGDVYVRAGAEIVCHLSTDPQTGTFQYMELHGERIPAPALLRLLRGRSATAPTDAALLTFSLPCPLLIHFDTPAIPIEVIGLLQLLEAPRQLPPNGAVIVTTPIGCFGVGAAAIGELWARGVAALTERAGVVLAEGEARRVGAFMLGYSGIPPTDPAVRRFRLAPDETWEPDALETWRVLNDHAIPHIASYGGDLPRFVYALRAHDALAGLAFTELPPRMGIEQTLGAAAARGLVPWLQAAGMTTGERTVQLRAALTDPAIDASSPPLGLWWALAAQHSAATDIIRVSDVARIWAAALAQASDSAAYIRQFSGTLHTGASPDASRVVLSAAAAREAWRIRLVHLVLATCIEPSDDLVARLYRAVCAQALPEPWEPPATVDVFPNDPAHPSYVLIQALLAVVTRAESASPDTTAPRPATALHLSGLLILSDLGPEAELVRVLLGDPPKSDPD
ncbi:MAG: hypothetical protein HY696_01100 [Deltaproteobacteria bacterium]|nr:hypothetical protein [Deltaproteobacteria bacterium]